jgi:hypothetical protein
MEVAPQTTGEQPAACSPHPKRREPCVINAALDTLEPTMAQRYADTEVAFAPRALICVSDLINDSTFARRSIDLYFKTRHVIRRLAGNRPSKHQFKRG